eukprot:1044589-Amphidinium_carterae.1
MQLRNTKQDECNAMVAGEPHCFACSSECVAHSTLVRPAPDHSVPSARDDAAVTPTTKHFASFGHSCLCRCCLVTHVHPVHLELSEAGIH